MATRDARRLLFGAGAVIVAGWAAATMWTVGQSVAGLAGSGSGSGGIGAVSGGLIEMVLPFAACAVANRLLVRKARRTGGTVLTLHRAHSFLLLFLVGLAVIPVVLFAAFQFPGLDPISAMIAMIVLEGLGFASQLLVLAAILALFARTQQQAED